MGVYCPNNAALLSAGVCGIVTPSGGQPQNKNGASDTRHGHRRPANASCASSVTAFAFHAARSAARPPAWRALLRTNLGRAAARRREIIAAHAGGAGPAGASWRDVPMQKTGDVWEIELPLAEAGFFKAKAYLLDEKGWQHWPEGPDVGICVHPDFARTANTIYCAFTAAVRRDQTTAVHARRKTRSADRIARRERFHRHSALRQTARPCAPVAAHRPHPRLPHPASAAGASRRRPPYARFGRFGSPYAALDLTAIDPALVEFDQRTTGVDQFCELTYAAHSLGARVFLDIVINHTGWGSTLQENHPEFFLRQPDGTFASPGAWGTTWEDLVELKQDDVALWDIIADALLTWCRRGRGRFPLRCRLQNSRARLAIHHRPRAGGISRNHFPARRPGRFLGSHRSLLTEGGMQWAYSELFQNYSGREVADYLDYANSPERARRHLRSLQRNARQRPPRRQGPRVVAAAQPSLRADQRPSGGFGFTCGVEWLAAEKIRSTAAPGLTGTAATTSFPNSRNSTDCSPTIRASSTARNSRA